MRQIRAASPEFLARASAILRDVVRNGGRDTWPHLASHGHWAPTIQGCISRGWLIEGPWYRYQITDSGRALAQAIDTRSAETAGLSPKGEGAVREAEAPK